MLCTLVAAEEKEEPCLQRAIQSRDQHRAVFFYPPKMQGRQVIDMCQEEEPHKPMRKGKRQQQQRDGGDGISALGPVSSKSTAVMTFLCGIKPGDPCSKTRSSFIPLWV